MRFCYCDESGTGDEPIATMVGIVVDAQRMHLTKSDWSDLLARLSAAISRQVQEFHTADFYAGNSPWRGLKGPERSGVISAIFKWLADRKHNIVYASVVKEDYYKELNAGNVPKELSTVWRFMAFHLILSMQRHCQKQSKNKGNTLFIFDSYEKERSRFGTLVLTPPSWSDAYYERGKKQSALDQIVDVPVFGDSQHVGLLQVADCLSFFARRHAEIKHGLVGPKYEGEERQIEEWMGDFASRSIPRSNIYPKLGRNTAHEVFYNLAPAALRDL